MRRNIVGDTRPAWWREIVDDNALDERNTTTTTDDDDDDEKRQLLNAQRAGAVPCGRLIAPAPGSATTGDVQNRCGSGGGGCGATHGA